MKSDLSEVISEFVKDKKERVLNPIKTKVEDIKGEIMQKLVSKKFGKNK